MTPERKAAAVRLLRTAANVGGRPMCSFGEWVEALTAGADALEATGEAPRLPSLPPLPVLSNVNASGLRRGQLVRTKIESLLDSS